MDFQLELRSQICYVYLLAFKHCKKRKKTTDAWFEHSGTLILILKSLS